MELRVWTTWREDECTHVDGRSRADDGEFELVVGTEDDGENLWREGSDTSITGEDGTKSFCNVENADAGKCCVRSVGLNLKESTVQNDIREIRNGIAAVINQFYLCCLGEKIGGKEKITRAERFDLDTKSGKTTSSDDEGELTCPEINTNLGECCTDGRKSKRHSRNSS